MIVIQLIIVFLILAFMAVATLMPLFVKKEDPKDMKEVICQKELPNGLIVWTREWRNMNSPEFDEVFWELTKNPKTGEYEEAYIVYWNTGRHANIRTLNRAYSRPELPCKPE